MATTHSILGIDASTKPAFVLLEFNPLKNEIPLVVHKQQEIFKERGLSLGSKIAELALDVISNHSVDNVVIEGYAQRGNYIIQSVEHGTILRYFLTQEYGLDFWYSIPPKSVKMYLTGNGNAQKQNMLKEVYKRFHFDTDSDDIADAYAVSLVGLGMEGHTFNLPKSHTRALAKLSKEFKH